METEEGQVGGFYLFVARVCPAAGKPDLKTTPPHKTETSSSQ
jgi:hypothetical protein